MTDSPQQALKAKAVSAGSMLREAREAAGLTHAAVGEALHLTGHYIRALENDDYNKLPGLIFVKGYIKSYGRYLKLDVDVLHALYEQRVESMPQEKNQLLTGSYTRKRNDQAIGWAIAATLVILLGLGFGWWLVGRGDQSDTAQVQTRTIQVIQNTPAANTDAVEQPAAEADSQPAANVQPEATGTTDAPTASPAAAASQPVAPSASTTVAPANTTDKISVTPTPAGGRQINLLGPGPDQLQMNFAANSWVEVDDGFGKRLYAEMLHAGDALQLQGRAPFQVLLGDARAVQVNFNAVPINIKGSVRNDFTARLTLANPGNSAPPVAENSANARTVGDTH